jgi:hypothetical protein
MQQVRNMILDIFNHVHFMKPYTITRENRALLLRISFWAQWQKIAYAIADEIMDHLNRVSEPNYVIIDLSNSNPSIEDIVISFNTYMRGNKAWIRHPNLKELFVLTHDPILSKTNSFTDSFQLGQLQVRVFHKLETAIAFINHRS